MNTTENLPAKRNGDGGEARVEVKRVIRQELPFVKVRKPHYCRLCGETIKVGELVYSWSSVEPGEGWYSTHVHPECYAETSDWRQEDWECCFTGDLERPKNVEIIPA